MIRAPKILVVQHMAVAHPGRLRTFLDTDGVVWQPVRLDLGEPIPNLDGFDALWVMGGSHDVWQEAEYPWLVAEKAAIRDAVIARRMPFLGICLGHQLLADALGGEVGPAAEPEIGVFEVTPHLAEVSRSPLAGLAAGTPVLQWHAAEVRRAPPGARVLAASPRCAVQALAVGDHALGLQFHAEVDAGTLDDWLGDPAATKALEDALGSGGPTRFAADAGAHYAGFERVARDLYDRFMARLPPAR